MVRSRFVAVIERRDPDLWDEVRSMGNREGAEIMGRRYGVPHRGRDLSDWMLDMIGAMTLQSFDIEGGTA